MDYRICPSSSSRTSYSDGLWPAFVAVEEWQILYNAPSPLLEDQRAWYLSWLSFFDGELGGTAAQISCKDFLLEQDFPLSAERVFFWWFSWNLLRAIWHSQPDFTGAGGGCIVWGFWRWNIRTISVCKSTRIEHAFNRTDRYWQDKLSESRTRANTTWSEILNAPSSANVPSLSGIVRHFTPLDISYGFYHHTPQPRNYD